MSVHLAFVAYWLLVKSGSIAYISTYIL